MNPENPTPPAPQPTAPQAVMPPPAAPQSPVQPTKPPTSTKKIILIVSLVVGGFVAFVAIILIAIFTTLYSATAEQANVSKQFIQDIQANNAEAAFAVTAAGFREATPKEEFVGLVDQESKALPKSTPEVVSRSTSSDNGVATAKIVTNIKGANGEASYHATTTLQKTNGTWQIMSIDIKAGLASSADTESDSSSAR